MLARSRMMLGLAAAAALIGAGSAAPAIMPRGPLVRPPTIREVRRGPRQWQKNERRKRAAEQRRSATERKRREAMERFDKPRADVQAIVNRLTNWQRKRWAGAGYPGLGEKNPALVQRFADMHRPAWL